MTRQALLCGFIVLLLPAAGLADEGIDFNRQIRPILSNNCFTCHGPNEADREGGLRLDRKDSAFGEAESGERAIVPGDAKQSELYQRISSSDDDLKMPPADSNKSLKPEQIELLRKWIEGGAKWSEHWALDSPKQVALPKVKDASWPRNEIDYFILARLEAEGLSPAKEADKETLIRRVTFDLTGLPPTLAEIDAFLADDAPDAYEKLVDRLLRSPRYGEHRARYWLDAARYGDTHGLHLDNYREIWPYRDWVIRAFNNNLPFDQFAITQLAGDLLPDPTEDQLVATGFNRCHVTTAEGGSIKEEVYVRNVVDRVVTTGTVFMGLTLDCTRCHDHKYDPFTMNDFYSLFAYFNSLDGDPMDGNKKDPAPVTKVLLPEQERQIDQERQQLAKLQQQITTLLADYDYQEPAIVAEAQPPQPQETVWIEDSVPTGVKAEGGWQFVGKPQPVFSGEKASTRTASGLSQHFFEGAKDALTVQEGDRLFAYVYLDPQNPPKQIMLQWNDGSWEHRAYWGGNHIPWGQENTGSRKRMGDLPKAGEWTRLDVAAAEVGLQPGAKLNGWAFTQFDGTTYWDKAGLLSLAGQNASFDSLLAWEAYQRAVPQSAAPPEIAAIIKLQPEQRNVEQKQLLRDYFLQHVFAKTKDMIAPLQQQTKQAQERIAQLRNSAATTLVFKETKSPRPAYYLNRGEYDQRRQQVPRATPASLPPMPSDAPNNRLGFARWLMSKDHPLTSRVTVNRFWLQLFGTGIVKTAEDFGSQGDQPSHPRLLDWLAVQFMQDGWDVKKTMKRIVMSSTYRQAPRFTKELLQRDPENRLLARRARFRLDAEMLRDQALSVSGLLVEKLGGPSVKPPQPDGLWFAVGYSGSNTVRFKADTGAERVHRRTLYTFIKRTSPPPQMSTLDGPSREACTVRRERTNTPLQALLMLNDPQYFEAARALAQRTMHDIDGSCEDRAAYMYRLCAGKRPSDAARAELEACYRDLLAELKSQPEEAKKIISVGSSPPDPSLDAPELAAWTMVANLVLNLDEVVTKN